MPSMPAHDLASSPYAPVNFPYAEKSARAYFGLNKDEMRALRREHLQAGIDFVTHKKGLWLAESALVKLHTALRPPADKTCGGSNGAAPDPAPAAPPEKSAPAIEELALVKVEIANPRIVLACRSVADWRKATVLVRLRVKSKDTLRRGMVLQCRLVQGYTDLYELAQHLPRRPVT